MESNVFSNPDVAILNGGKYFEDLLSLIMVTELIPEEKTVNPGLQETKEFMIMQIINMHINYVHCYFKFQFGFIRNILEIRILDPHHLTGH